MHSAGKPVWQQLTALVSLGASGAVTGFTFSPRAPADLTSPANLPIHLLALDKAAKPAAAVDAPLRSAIVNFAHLFLRMARGKTPAQMESIIWQHDSVDGVDHGQSCAAFASLTLELAAQAIGQHSWVTGGTSYPWPLHKWVDARVEPNPASPGITSVLQDAEAHHRWHPLGDGYRPLPGDWVLFTGHIEVVTGDAGGVLSTIGGDSLPNFSVNAHQYHDPLRAVGVTGFVNNGGQRGAQPRGHRSGRPRSSAPAHSTEPPATAVGPAAVAGPPVLAGPPADAGPPSATGPAAVAPAAASPSAAISPPVATSSPAAGPSADAGPASAVSHRAAKAASAAPADGVVIPGLPAADPGTAKDRWGTRLGQQPAGGPGRAGRDTAQPAHAHASVAAPAVARPSVSADPVIPGLGLPGFVTTRPPSSQPKAAAIPGLPIAPLRLAVGPAHRRHHHPVARQAVARTPAQQAFINEIAPGAVAAQRRYGVPASVTIAQAIVESGWGQSQLASQDHNLFGIKGTGPAGSVQEPSWEYLNGQSVLQNSSFRVYRNAAESIDDHGRLLATSEYYRRTMSYRRDPNAFASSLTGIYATDPEYGTQLISLMRRYNLYRYDQVAPPAAPRPAAAGSGAAAGPVPPVSLPSPAVVPAASTPASPQPANPQPTTAPPVTQPPVTSPPVTQPPGAPGSLPTQPASTAPTLGPQPVATLPASPGPLPPQAVPAQPVSAPPATPGPVVTFPASPAPATPQQGSAGPGHAWPHRNEAPLSPPGTHGPAPSAPGNRGAAPARTGSYGAAPPRSRHQTPQLAPPGQAQPVASQQPAHQHAAVAPARPQPARTAAPNLQPGMVPPVSAPPAGVPSGAAAASTPRPAEEPAPLPPPVPPRRRQVPRTAPARSARATTAATTTAAIEYRHHIPLPVRHAFTATARATLLRAEPLYRDVASDTGIDWRLLAACDWMQCEAHPRHSPVLGERLGTVNPDGTVYRTRSEALAQCALELVDLAHTVYEIDLTSPAELSVRDLASTFAAFRWGGLLKAHRTSAMEFPYSVAGLTEQHRNMRWPDIADPNTPDKPGSRFRKPFGAVPIVLSLDLPATV